MKILVVGSGAREHALGKAISKNKKVSKLYFAPGNAGTEIIGENIDIKSDDINRLLEFAKNNDIGYTVVGPEDPLCAGIVDLFEANGLKIFGPSKSAARLEESKAYAKEFMEKYDIPTASYKKTDNLKYCLEAAYELIEKNGAVVLKADALCQGKGVFIANSKDEAETFAKKIFIDKLYGNCEMVVEEFLDGFEMSLLCFVDNNTIKMLPTAKDHKKIFEGELGLNTGGMGTYSPNNQADVYLEEIEALVLKPFLSGIKSEKLDFRGIVFIGFMIGSNGIKVLEFNTRFGDPETQSVLQRLETDLLEIMEHTSEGRLDQIDIEFNDKKVITLVLASGGYPEAYQKGYEIKGLTSVKDAELFHAGTLNKAGKIVTNGGRVLSITASETSFEAAYEKVYRAAKEIEFKDKFYRKDISPLVKRVYVEKLEAYNVERTALIREIKDSVGINLKNVRCLVRYDIENISDEELQDISDTILSESPVDNIYMFEEALKLQKELENPLVVEFHNGQFDQRQQGLLDTIAVAIEKNDVSAKCARVYSFEAENGLTANEMKKIEKLLINPVDQQKG
ncbi:MAG: phosphoribosylamine--glycine ligase, partial [Proteocatella sp.]